MHKLFVAGFLLFYVLTGELFAQSSVVIKGKVTDEMNEPIPYANISVVNKAAGTSTGQMGRYRLKLLAADSIHLKISNISYKDKYIDIAVNDRDQIKLNIKMKIAVDQLPQAEVKDEYSRAKGLVRISPKQVENLPTSGNFENIVKTLPGVSSNNELSSQYNVRGGNFDENLVYVNDIRIYRPFLVRSGQQEGLSFINNNLVSSVVFSAGGFDASYGDKLSSVLDIKYKKPRKTAGSFSASLLGASAHIEGVNKNHRLSYLFGARYKTNKYLLSSLDTEGQYDPDFLDIQAYAAYDVSDEFELSFLGHLGQNTYRFMPQDRETSWGTINEAYKLNIYFEGQEKNSYTTGTGAITAKYHKLDKLEMKFIASGFFTKEKERFDILGQYYMNKLENNLGEEDFGDSITNVGVGSFLKHADNDLNAGVMSFSHEGRLLNYNNVLYWGLKYQFEDIDYSLHEWKMVDSAGYSLPYSDEEVLLNFTDISDFDIYSHRASAYVMGDYEVKSDFGDINLNAGLRGNYWSFNNQFVLSPRVSASLDPYWEKNFIFRLSGGLYHQPPFFKEFIRRDGTINHNIKAQSSAQIVLGSDYVFKAWDRQFKLVTEAYYKYLYNLIPYDIDNVRIRYYGENMANGYATGLDIKVNGEFVPGTESWFSLSIMQTKEDIENDFYCEYFKDGEKLEPGSSESPDSVTMIEPGLIPRPTDQRVTAAIFFQDYLPGNPSWKAHLKLVYGTGLPFGPPNSDRYLHTGRLPDYRRVDLGISKQIITKNTDISETSPLSFIKDFWISLEVFNLLDINNTISHLWVSDIYGRQYAVPNYLTGRRINFKMNMRF